jgi:glycosyltransferase involved in cell wall biosynthesis
MRVVILTNIVSPHLMPLAEALVARLGADAVRYVATEGTHTERETLGWVCEGVPQWVVFPAQSESARAEATAWCARAPVLLSGLRQLNLFEARAAHGLHSLYFSERWFKPPWGALRMAHPRYARMAARMARLLRQGHVTYLPVGVHAGADMLRMTALHEGNIALFLQPIALRPIIAEPMSRLFLAGAYAATTPGGKVALEHMRLWCYFVSDSDSHAARTAASTPRPADAAQLSVLWLGRMLGWKRADTLVGAVKHLLDDGEAVHLHLVGYGPEDARLQEMAGRHLIRPEVAGVGTGMLEAAPGIRFSPPVPIQATRGLMRSADVVVLSSDGGEGWGAVVAEAMAESCLVIGTWEAGSSATMIQHGRNGWLFHAGRQHELSQLLRRIYEQGPAQFGAIAQQARRDFQQHWTAELGAERLLAFAAQRPVVRAGAVVANAEK